MSYQVLARKWRPKNFKEMAGQSHVLQTLVHALENGRLHHAYLFTGTRGVGKTTIARIFAKCLNCERGVSATPCGECGACREIAEGRFIDLIEVDAASRTKVEDTRELLENVQYAPSRGRFKVYLIDEVHMLSTNSFNALLKTLEEPPPHVKFLLATTDPQKLPVTILSRCLQFSLKNFMPDKIVDYLQTVLVAEQVAFEEPALWHLARAAQGSMRDALTLLDQAIAFGEGRLLDAGVQAMLGTPDQMLVFRLLECISNQDAPALLECAARIAEQNANYHQILESMMSALHRAAISQVLPRAIDNSNGDREQILHLGRELSAEDIQLYYQITLKSRADLSIAPDLQMAFEMFLLRLLAFTPDGPVQHRESLDSSRPDKSLHQPVDEPAAQDQAEVKKKPLISPELPAAETFSPDADLPPPAPAPVLRPVRDEAAIRPDAVDTDNWINVVERCGLGGICGNLLANCVPERATADLLELVLDERQSSLFNDQYLVQIREALQDFFGSGLGVQIRVGQPAGESPAAFRTRVKQEQRQSAIDNFHNDGNVRQIIDRFSATVRPESLKIHSEDKS